VKNVKKHWDTIDYEINKDPNQLHEANLLKLDCSKAHILLKWKDVWDSDTTFEKTVKWYKSFYEENAKTLTKDDLENYINDAKSKNIEWSK
jgi:CDP-glucose 4,6-dehydratase